jgi:hypothetical protein
MFAVLKSWLMGEASTTRPNQGGPGYRPPFSIANPACFGETRFIDQEPIDMAVIMIKSTKDHDAINFARHDLSAYHPQIRGDYVLDSHFESNYIRY